MRLLDEITVGKYTEENPQNTPSANNQDDTDIRFYLTFFAQNVSVSTEAHKIMLSVAQRVRSFCNLKMIYNNKFSFNLFILLTS